MSRDVPVVPGQLGDVKACIGSATNALAHASFDGVSVERTRATEACAEGAMRPDRMADIFPSMCGKYPESVQDLGTPCTADRITPKHRHAAELRHGVEAPQFECNYGSANGNAQPISLRRVPPRDDALRSSFLQQLVRVLLNYATMIDEIEIRSDTHTHLSYRRTLQWPEVYGMWRDITDFLGGPLRFEWRAVIPRQVSTIYGVLPREHEFNVRAGGMVALHRQLATCPFPPISDLAAQRSRDMPAEYDRVVGVFRDVIDTMPFTHGPEFRRAVYAVHIPMPLAHEQRDVPMPNPGLRGYVHPLSRAVGWAVSYTRRQTRRVSRAIALARAHVAVALTGVNIWNPGPGRRSRHGRPLSIPTRRSHDVELTNAQIDLLIQHIGPEVIMCASNNPAWRPLLDHIHDCLTRERDAANLRVVMKVQTLTQKTVKSRSAAAERQIGQALQELPKLQEDLRQSVRVHNAFVMWRALAEARGPMLVDERRLIAILLLAAGIEPEPGPSRPHVVLLNGRDPPIGTMPDPAVRRLFTDGQGRVCQAFGIIRRFRHYAPPGTINVREPALAEGAAPDDVTASIRALAAHMLRSHPGVDPDDIVLHAAHDELDLFVKLCAHINVRPRDAMRDTALWIHACIAGIHEAQAWFRATTAQADAERRQAYRRAAAAHKIRTAHRTRHDGPVLIVDNACAAIRPRGAFCRPPGTEEQPRVVRLTRSMRSARHRVTVEVANPVITRAEQHAYRKHGRCESMVDPRPPAFDPYRALRMHGFGRGDTKTAPPTLERRTRDANVAVRFKPFNQLAGVRDHANIFVSNERVRGVFGCLRRHGNVIRHNDVMVAGRHDMAATLSFVATLGTDLYVMMVNATRDVPVPRTIGPGHVIPVPNAQHGLCFYESLTDDAQRLRVEFAHTLDMHTFMAFYGQRIAVREVDVDGATVEQFVALADLRTDDDAGAPDETFALLRRRMDPAGGWGIISHLEQVLFCLVARIEIYAVMHASCIERRQCIARSYGLGERFVVGYTDTSDGASGHFERLRRPVRHVSIDAARGWIYTAAAALPEPTAPPAPTPDTTLTSVVAPTPSAPSPPVAVDPSSVATARVVDVGTGVPLPPIDAPTTYHATAWFPRVHVSDHLTCHLWMHAAVPAHGRVVVQRHIPPAPIITSRGTLYGLRKIRTQLCNIVVATCSLSRLCVRSDRHTACTTAAAAFVATVAAALSKSVLSARCAKVAGAVTAQTAAALALVAIAAVQKRQHAIAFASKPVLPPLATWHEFSERRGGTACLSVARDVVYRILRYRDRIPRDHDPNTDGIGFARDTNNASFSRALHDRIPFEVRGVMHHTDDQTDFSCFYRLTSAHVSVVWLCTDDEAAALVACTHSHLPTNVEQWACDGPTGHMSRVVVRHDRTFFGRRDPPRLYAAVIHTARCAAQLNARDLGTLRRVWRRVRHREPHNIAENESSTIAPCACAANHELIPLSPAADAVVAYLVDRAQTGSTALLTTADAVCAFGRQLRMLQNDPKAALDSGLITRADLRQVTQETTEHVVGARILGAMCYRYQRHALMRSETPHTVPQINGTSGTTRILTEMATPEVYGCEKCGVTAARRCRCATFGSTHACGRPILRDARGHYCGFCDNTDIAKFYQLQHAEANTHCLLYDARRCQGMRSFVVPALTATKFGNIGDDAKLELFPFDYGEHHSPQLAGIGFACSIPFASERNYDAVRSSMQARALAAMPDHPDWQDVDDMCTHVLGRWERHSVFPVPFDLFVSRFPAAKRERLRRARDALREDRLKPRDCFRSLFLKDEKLTKDLSSGRYAARVISSTSDKAQIALGPTTLAASKFLMEEWDGSTDSGPDGWSVLYAGGRTSEEIGRVVHERMCDGFTYCADGDYSSFDASVHRDALRTEHRLYRHLTPLTGNAETALKAQLDPRGVFTVKRELVARFSSSGRRQSGDSNTSVGNSFLNALVIFAVFKKLGLAPGFLSICGDDVLILLAYMLTEAQRVAIVEQIARYGMKLELQVRESYEQVHYLGSRLLKMHHMERGETILLVPEMGRALAKFGWSLHVEPDISGWMHQVALGFRHLIHVPVLGALVRRTLQLTDAPTKTRVLNADMPYLVRMGGPTLVTHADTYADFAKSYGITVEHVLRLEKMIDCVPSLPHIIDGPDFEPVLSLL